MTQDLDALPLPERTYATDTKYNYGDEDISAARREGYELAKREAVTVEAALKVITDAMRTDPEYAWSWHCNIAMAFVDEGGDHAMANHAAARFMKLLANVEPAHELPERKAQEGREPVASDYFDDVPLADEVLEAIRERQATSPPPKSDEPCGLFEVRVAGPDDVHSHDSEIEALRQANDINLQYVADCLKHPDSADHVMCVATVHKTDESKSAEPVASLTGPERVWTCTVIGKAEDLPRGSDAPMRKAVFDAFAQQTGDAPAHIFSCWGNPVPERYRAVMENRLPDPEVIRKECLEVLNILPKSDELPTCTEERPCVNCFAGTTPCLGPHKRPPKSDEAMDALIKAARWFADNPDSPKSALGHITEALAALAAQQSKGEA